MSVTENNGFTKDRTVGWRRSGIPPEGYTIEPGDGHWSWVVLFGSCISVMIVSNSYTSYGVLLPDLRILLTGTSVSILTLAPTIAISLSCFAGPLAAIMLQACSCRKTVVLGSLLISSGFSMLYFVNGTTMLLAIYGIFIGLGSGLNYPAFPVVLSQYFRKHYGVANGFMMAGAGMAKFILAPVTEYLRNEYGCRGTFLLLGAISMHGCVGAALFQPPKWHNVLVAMVDKNEVINRHDKQPPNGVSNTVLDSKQVITNCNHEEQTNTAVVVNIDSDTNKELTTEVPQNRNALIRFFTTIDYTLLKWPMFYLGAINNSILTFSLTFSAIFFYPLGLDVGLEPMHAAMAVSIRAFGEIAGRGFGPVICAYFNLPSRWCTIVVFTLNGILCFILINATSMAYFMTVGVTSGVVFGCCVSLNGQLIMENIGRKRLPAFLGLAAPIQGIMMLPMGPFLGWIRDVTGTYKNVFLVIGVMQLVMALLWIVRPYLSDAQKQKPVSGRNKT